MEPRGRQRTDSTHVLTAIQVLNRLALIGETLRQALNALAAAVPGWLRSWVPVEWFARGGRRFEEYRLPDALAERPALAEQLGADVRHLLAVIGASDEYAWLRRVPAVETPRRVWVQRCCAGGPPRRREAKDLPPAALTVSSPYDPEARDSTKRETVWTGYKVHVTEACGGDLPSVVTDVDTTVATTVDHAMTAAVPSPWRR